MRRIIIVLALSIIGFAGFGQEVNYPVNGKRVVKVKDWQKKALFLRKDYWSLYRESLIPQIGKDEFEKVIRYSDVRSIPYQLTLYKGFQKIPEDSLALLSKKLDRLICYKIADLVYGGKEVGVKPAVLIRIPYEENKDWDPTAKWDNVYFIIPADQVEVGK
jgi:hypothetical protein